MFCLYLNIEKKRWVKNLYLALCVGDKDERPNTFHCLSCDSFITVFAAGVKIEGCLQTISISQRFTCVFDFRFVSNDQIHWFVKFPLCSGGSVFVENILRYFF